MSDDNEWQDGHPLDDWSEAQADLYGRVFRFLLNNQKNVTHPNTTPMNGREWRTLAHTLLQTCLKVNSSFTRAKS